MERIANTLLPARMFVVCSNANYGNDFQSAKAKSKYHFFVVFTVGNWKLYGMAFLRNGIRLEIWGIIVY